MHGTTHPLSEPLNDHYNGHCTMVPETVSYRDLGLDVDAPEIEIESGEAWFRSQPRETQIEMMGLSKWQAWQSGAFEFDSLATTSPDPAYGDMVTEDSLFGIIGEQAEDYYSRKAA